MSKPISLQSSQRASVATTNTLNPPLQIQPKPVVTVLQGQSRVIQAQPVFNQYIGNLQSNFAHAGVNRTQAFNMATNNSFTFTLAPIQAKPMDSGNISNNITVLPSNFPPIQMRPNSNNPRQQQPLSVTTASVNVTSAATGGYYRDWILESIDKLRERKARPDSERISTLMKRYHNIPIEDTVSCLNKLADTGSVVCVDYKGNISYRNPYKWRKNSANGGGIMNAPSITNRILEAFQHLDRTRNPDQVPGQSKNGYTITDFEHALTATQSGSSVELTKAQLRHCLEREAAYGKLLRGSDSTYVIDENGEKKIRKAATIQAKKTANKPIINKSIAAAPPVGSHTITMATSQSMLTSIQNNVNNNFPTFAVQQYPSQMTQFISPSERQILPMLTTSTPYVSSSSQQQLTTQLSQPSPILPKLQIQPQMPVLKCEPTSPINYAKFPLSKAALVTKEQADTTIAATTVTSTTNPVPVFEMRTAKLSRRGRPPGSKNKRFQDSENISSQLSSNKRLKSDLDNNGTNVSVGSSCSVHSISNSDQTVPATGSIIELCAECKGPQTEYDKFLCCKDCLFKVHPSCLQYWPELTERARLIDWQCGLCKTCSICSDHRSKESVFICDGCDKGFHANCHEPKIEEPVSSNTAWICENCHSEGFRIKAEETIKSPMENVGTESIEKTVDIKNFVDKTNIDLNTNTERITLSKASEKTYRTHEVVNWSVDEVCDWLTDEGFGKQSGSFRDQEIDGACLLLMKRIDVLTELNIKLGPAVKIYERIKKIQNDGSVWRCDDCF